MFNIIHYFFIVAALTEGGTIVTPKTGSLIEINNKQVSAFSLIAPFYRRPF